MRVVTVGAMRELLGEHIRCRAHGGIGGEYGGCPFEGKSPQAVIEDADGNQHHLTIETIADLEVERRSWESVA